MMRCYLVPIFVELFNVTIGTFEHSLDLINIDQLSHISSENIELESCFENRCWKAQTAGLRSLSLPLLLDAVQCQATSNLKSFPISSTINISGCDDDPAAKLSHWRHTKLMMANAAATTNLISKMQIFAIIDSGLIIPF